MALQLDTNHGGFTANYWALGPQVNDPLQGKLRVTLNLYKDSAAYVADKNGNILRSFGRELIINSDLYDTIFNPANTVSQMLVAIFMAIMAMPDELDPEQPGYFANATIVP